MEKNSKIDSFLSSYKSIILMILLLFISLSFSFISTNLFILAFFGFLPTLVAISIDKHPRKFLSRIIFLFNILGSIHLFLEILFHPNNIDQISYLVISIPHTWLVIYSSCAFGWIIYLLVPKIIYYFSYSNKLDLLDKLNKELNDIYLEWGEENINVALNEISKKKN